MFQLMFVVLVSAVLVLSQENKTAPKGVMSIPSVVQDPVAAPGPLSAIGSKSVKSKLDL